MKTHDIHGRPVLTKQQLVEKAERDEGLNELDLEELRLLDDTQNPPKKKHE